MTFNMCLTFLSTHPHAAAVLWCAVHYAAFRCTVPHERQLVRIMRCIAQQRFYIACPMAVQSPLRAGTLACCSSLSP